MKKVLLSLGLCVLLCGCGNKLTCTAESDGMKSKATFTMKGDTLTSLKEEYTFDSEDDAKTFCSLMELGKNTAKMDDLTVKCSGKKVSVSSKNVKAYYDSDKKDVTIDNIVVPAKYSTKEIIPSILALEASLLTD